MRSLLEQARRCLVRRPAGAATTPRTKENAMARSTLPATETEVPTRLITGGVDTHLDVHVAAALDQIGGLLGTASFATTPAGYRQLLGWLQSFGTISQVGIEGTSSYGAGLTRALQQAAVTV